MTPPREVQIRWYRQLVWELIDRGFDIYSVTFDGFQSQDIIQALSSWGINTGLLSLDRNDKVYQSVKDIILDSRLIAYSVKGDPEEPLAMRELSRLRRVGKKVDHLPSFSKDASDALAGSVWGAVEAGGEEASEDLTSILTGFTVDAEMPEAYLEGYHQGFPAPAGGSSPWASPGQMPPPPPGVHW